MHMHMHMYMCMHMYHPPTHDPCLQEFAALQWLLPRVPELRCPLEHAGYVHARAKESQCSERARLGQRGPERRRKPQGESHAQALQRLRDREEARLERRLKGLRVRLERWEEEEEMQRQKAREWQEQQRQLQAAAAEEEEMQRQKAREWQEQQRQLQAAAAVMPEVAAVVNALVNQLVTTVHARRPNPNPDPNLSRARARLRLGPHPHPTPTFLLGTLTLT